MNTEKITIREARVEDAQAVLDFLQVVTQETDNLLLTPEEVGNKTVMDEESALVDFLTSKRKIYLVAIKNNLVVGTASLVSFERKRNQHRGTFDMSIRKAYWGEGIGYLLLAKLILFAKSINLKLLELEVRSDNDAAIRLYQKSGFETYGHYKNYMLIDGQFYDCLLMVKDLT